jgi:hypothetical protein
LERDQRLYSSQQKELDEKSRRAKDEVRRSRNQDSQDSVGDDKSGDSLWSKTKRAFGAEEDDGGRDRNDEQQRGDRAQKNKRRETPGGVVSKGHTLHSLGSAAEPARRGDYGSESAKRTTDGDDDARDAGQQKGRRTRREIEDRRDKEIEKQEKAQRERTGKSGVDISKWEQRQRDGIKDDDDEAGHGAYEYVRSSIAGAKDRVMGNAGDATDRASAQQQESHADESSHGTLDRVKEKFAEVKERAVELKEDAKEKLHMDSKHQRGYDDNQDSFGDDRGVLERVKETIKDAASSVKDKAFKATGEERFEDAERQRAEFARTRDEIKKNSDELRERSEARRKGGDSSSKNEPVDETDERVSRLAISENTAHPERVFRRDLYAPMEKVEKRPDVDYSGDKERPPQSYAAIKAARTGFMSDPNDTHKDVFTRALDGVAEATAKLFRTTDKKDSLAQGVWYNDKSEDRAEMFHRQTEDPMYGRREKAGDLSKLEEVGFHMDKQQDLERLAARDPEKYIAKKKQEQEYGNDPRIRAMNSAKDDSTQFFDDADRDRECEDRQSSFGEDRGTLERAKEMIKDAASSVKEKAFELKDAVKERAVELKDDAKEKLHMDRSAAMMISAVATMMTS